MHVTRLKFFLDDPITPQVVRGSIMVDSLVIAVISWPFLSIVFSCHYTRPLSSTSEFMTNQMHR